jgi:ribosomal protein S10
LKHYKITLKSKNKESLNKFIKFFKNNLRIKQINKIYQKPKKKKLFTILKSPHINKSAQEQFKINFYSLNFIFYVEKNNQIIKLIKKIQLNSFTDVFIKVKAFYSKNLIKKKYINFFNPNNFINKSLGFFLYKNKNLNNENYILNYQKLKKLIVIYDTFGEISLKI